MRARPKTPIPEVRNEGGNGARTTPQSPTRKQDAAEQDVAERPNGRAVPEEAKQPKGNFFHKLAQLSEDDWDRHMVYVYRRWPRISKNGQPHYIGTHREALPGETIKG